MDDKKVEKKKNRLRSSKDFKIVYEKGKSFANKYLVMFFVKNDLTYNRLGFVTTKKLGNSVVRNKFKRRLREAYKLNSNKFKKGYDIILLSRTNAQDTNYKQIDSALNHIMKIAKLLEQNESVKEKK